MLAAWQAAQLSSKVRQPFRVMKHLPTQYDVTFTDQQNIYQSHEETNRQQKTEQAVRSRVSSKGQPNKPATDVMHCVYENVGATFVQLPCTKTNFF